MIAIQLPPAAEVLVPSLDFSTVEGDLVRGIQNKSAGKFSLLYKMYAPALLGIISRIVRSEIETEDVLQETFVKIWNSIAGYDPARGRLFTWMAATARHAAIDHLRGRAQINAEKNSDIEEFSNELESSFRVSYNPDAIGLKQLTFNLHASEKEVVDLIYFYGYTHSEAAEELGIPLGTLKTRLRRAILTLRGYF